MSSTITKPLALRNPEDDVTKIVPVVLPKILSGYSVREIAEQNDVPADRVKELLISELASIHHDSLQFANMYTCLSLVQIDLLIRAILKQVDQSIMSPEVATEYICALTRVKILAAEAIQKIASTKKRKTAKNIASQIAKAIASIPTEQLLQAGDQND